MNYRLPLSFQIHYADIDEQHIVLVSTVNDCLDATQNGDTDRFLNHLGNFIGLLAEHFEYEEALMSNNRYPWLPNHHVHHKDALEKVRRLRDRLVDQDVNMAEIPPILFNEILFDIARADFKFNDYLIGADLKDAC